jgi:multidrug efflux pump
LLPVQDTGRLSVISEASQAVSFGRMAELQQALAARILRDPDVVSLSSFIGVDGTNPTLNTGRFLINLKPREDRTATASDVIRRLRGDVAAVGGISLFMQPVQDLSIDTTERTQYQFVLVDANPTSSRCGSPTSSTA